MKHFIQPSNIDFKRAFYLNDTLIEVDQGTITQNKYQQSIQPKQMQVLLYLSKKAKQVVSTDELITHCWDTPFISDSPVHKCIAQIRKKLGDNTKSPNFIKTFPKKGYMLIANINQTDYLEVKSCSSANTDPLLLPAYSHHKHRHYFGRHQTINQLLAKISYAIEQQTAWLTIFGDKKVGKSSLIHAGIIPRLATLPGQYNKAIILDLKHFIAITPYVAFLAQLIQKNILSANKPLEFYAAILKNKPEQLHSYLSAKRFTVFIDHFEGVLSKENIAMIDVQLLFVLLHSLIKSRRCLLVTLVTSHHLSTLKDCAASYHLCFKQIEVPHFSFSEVAELITQTAKQSNLEFQYDHSTRNRLDHLILQQWLHHPFPTNVLQHLLTKLCNKQNGNTQTCLTWQKTGGLFHSMATLVQANFDKLTKNEKYTFDKLLFNLVMLNETSRVVSGPGMEKTKLPSTINQKTLTKLLDLQLICQDLEGKINLIHPSIIEHWPYLRKWVQINFNWLLLRQDLTRLTKCWLLHQKNSVFLIKSRKQYNDITKIVNHKYLVVSSKELSFCVLSQKKYIHRRKRILALLLLATIAISASVVNVIIKKEVEGYTAQSIKQDSLTSTQ